MGKVQWVHVAMQTPDEGEHVVVYNGKHVWSTTWRPAFTSERLQSPVTHWAQAIDLPYPLRNPKHNVDPKEMDGVKYASKSPKR